MFLFLDWLTVLPTGKKTIFDASVWEPLPWPPPDPVILQTLVDSQLLLNTSIGRFSRYLPSLLVTELEMSSWEKTIGETKPSMASKLDSAQTINFYESVGQILYFRWFRLFPRIPFLVSALFSTRFCLIRSFRVPMAHSWSAEQNRRKNRHLQVQVVRFFTRCYIKHSMADWYRMTIQNQRTWAIDCGDVADCLTIMV